MSEQGPIAPVARLLRWAARDERVYANMLTEQVATASGRARLGIEQTAENARVRAKALDLLAVEWALLEAVVAATRALTKWNHRHSCEECEEGGLYVACDVVDTALRALDVHRALREIDAHRAGSAGAAGEGDRE